MSFDLQNTRKNKILLLRGSRTMLNEIKTDPKSTKVVKKSFSWKFHFSAYNVCPDKSF